MYKNENLVHTKIEITKLYTFVHLSDQNGKTVIDKTIILIFILIKKNNRPFKPNINTFKIRVHFFNFFVHFFLRLALFCALFYKKNSAALCLGQILWDLISNIKDYINIRNDSLLELRLRFNIGRRWVVVL